jgi:hypothetical protein
MAVSSSASRRSRPEIRLHGADAGAVPELFGELDHGAGALTVVLEAVLRLGAFPAALDQGLGLVRSEAIGNPAIEVGTMLLGEARGHLGTGAARRLQRVTVAALRLIHTCVVAAAAERMPVADLTHQLVDAVVGLGVRPNAAALAMTAAVCLPGPMAATTTSTIAPAVPAAIALAAAIVLGQRRLPDQPKLAIVHGQDGRHRDQGQGRAACQEKPGYGRAGSGI